MAFRSLRLRRTLSLSTSILNHSLQPPLSIHSTYSYLRSIPIQPTLVAPEFTRPFTSTTTLFRKPFDPETDEIGEDTILFEGCDYNHWLITVDFPKDSNLSRDQMIETYVNIASQVFGSVEEAKKKIYALSTTTYQGFQVECSEETSEKFKSISQVVFVLPDSYIDPVNKEYGGDKYVNGEIFPRPPPVHYVRRNRDRGPREFREGNAPYRNYGPPPQQPPSPSHQSYGQPPPQQNYAPPSHQSYGQPPPQQNYGPPSQQNYGPPNPQQNYGPPSQQNYGPPNPQQNYGPPSYQNHGRPNPQQNYGPPSQQQSYGQQNYRPASQQQSYGQQNYGPPSQQQSYTQQNYGPPPQQNYRNQYSPPPQHQSDGNSSNPANGAYGQQSSDRRGYPQDANHGFERK